MSDPGTDCDLARDEAVLFANADWRVLADGLEHRTTGYFIGRDALAARHGDGLWQWPLHLAEKSWCTPRLFREAFTAALDRFGHAGDAALTRSFAVGFGTRPGSSVARDGFTALGELVRPRPAARKRPDAKAAPRPAARGRIGTPPRMPAGASA